MKKWRVANRDNTKIALIEAETAVDALIKYHNIIGDEINKSAIGFTWKGGAWDWVVGEFGGEEKEYLFIVGKRKNE